MGIFSESFKSKKRKFQNELSTNKKGIGVSDDVVNVNDVRKKFKKEDL